MHVERWQGSTSAPSVVVMGGDERPRSELMVVQSPFSMVGAFKRVANLRHRLPAGWPVVARVLVTVPILLVAVVAGALGLVWTLIFGLLSLPWRLLRRGSRRRKVEHRRHQEVLSASRQQPPPAG